MTISSHDLLFAAGFRDPKQELGSSSWEIWTASVLVGRQRFDRRFLIINHDCSLKELDATVRAAAHSQERLPPTIIVRNSNQRLATDLERVRSILDLEDALTASEFMADEIQRALNQAAPTPTREDFGLQYFVEPSLQFPEDSSEVDALSSLTQWLRGHRPSRRKIAVLLGPGGIGKSTLTMELFRQMAGARFTDIIPLLVNRDTWLDIDVRSDVGLFEIWSSALTEWYPSVILGRDQLQSFLGFGAIRVIFDGLDELCSRFSNAFAVDDVIEQLDYLIDDGRILISSRRSFWEANATTSTRAQVLEIDLQPFSQRHRDLYLERRFPKESEKRSAAVQILDRLTSVTRARLGARTARQPNAVIVESPLDRFDTIPYVIMLAAESADTDRPDTIAKFGALLVEDDPVQALLLMFCERERERQRLPVDAATQLKIFSVAASEFGPIFSEEELLAAGMEYDLEPSVCKGLLDHDLLAKRSGRLSFKYDFLYDFLVGRVVKEWLLQHSATIIPSRALEACISSPGILERVGDLVFASPTATANWSGQARQRWHGGGLNGLAQEGFIQLVLLLGYRSSSDRASTRELLQYVTDSSADQLRNVPFRGLCPGIDVRSTRLLFCVFSDCELKAWVFDDDSVFEDCVFNGELRITGCERFETARFEGGRISPMAKLAIQAAAAGRRKFPVDREQIINAVVDVLRRFRRGHGGFVTRKVDGVRRSVPKAIPFGNQLLDTLERVGVLTMFNAGSEDIYKVSDTAEVRIFLDNRAPVGRIRKAVDTLTERLSGKYFTN